MNPINQILGRNIPEDAQVNQILENGDTPMPKLGNFKRYFYGIFELTLTFLISILPIWETDLYIRFVYHNLFGERIKNMHKEEEEQIELVEGGGGEVRPPEQENQPQGEEEEEEEGVIVEELGEREEEAVNQDNQDQREE